MEKPFRRSSRLQRSALIKAGAGHLPENPLMEEIRGEIDSIPNRLGGRAKTTFQSQIDCLRALSDHLEKNPDRFGKQHKQALLFSARLLRELPVNNPVDINYLVSRHDSDLGAAFQNLHEYNLKNRLKK